MNKDVEFLQVQQPSTSHNNYAAFCHSAQIYIRRILGPMDSLVMGVQGKSRSSKSIDSMSLNKLRTFWLAQRISYRERKSNAVCGSCRCGLAPKLCRQAGNYADGWIRIQHRKLQELVRWPDRQLAARCVPRGCGVETNMTYHRGIAFGIQPQRKVLARALPLLRAVLVAAFALALLARFAAAQSTTVTVNANQGPWVQSLNPSFNYGDATNAAPTVVDASSGIPFNPGGTVTVTYVSGLVNVFPEGGFLATDANGNSGDATNNMVIATYGSYPSYFINSSSYPVYASELIGTFANNGVIVGNPFPVGDGPKTFTIPSGANQLLLGVDDNDYADNTGSWQVKVTYAPAAGSTTGNPTCYQFSGPGATLEIDITSFASQQDDKATSSGYTSRDTFEGNNSLMIGGSTKTSTSTSNTPDCVGCLLGSAVFSYSSGTNLTVFTMTVPADDTPGDMNSWFVTLGGAGNLIPSGVLPQSQLFPPISSWPVNAQITVASGGIITSYPVTSITSCSLAAIHPASPRAE